MPVCHWCKRGIHNAQISSILIVSYSVRLKFCVVACAYHLMAKILSMLVSHWSAWTACVQIVVDHLLKRSYDYFEMRSIVDLVVSDCFQSCCSFQRKLLSSAITLEPDFSDSSHRLSQNDSDILSLFIPLLYELFLEYFTLVNNCMNCEYQKAFASKHFIALRDHGVERLI